MSHFASTFDTESSAESLTLVQVLFFFFFFCCFQ